MNTPIRAIFLDAGNTLLFPQVEKLAEDMEAAGFPMRPEHFHQAERAGLSEYLEFVIDSSLVGVEKPHPEIFEMALERSGIKPDEAVYVGDTYPTDIGGAELAGLHGILIDWVGAYPDATCPRIKTLSELSVFLEQLSTKRGDYKLGDGKAGWC